MHMRSLGNRVAWRHINVCSAIAGSLAVTALKQERQDVRDITPNTGTKDRRSALQIYGPM